MFLPIPGTLNVLLRVRSIASVDSVVWTKSGHQGPDWKRALFDVSPSGPFQVTHLIFRTQRWNLNEICIKCSIHVVYSLYLVFFLVFFISSVVAGCHKMSNDLNDIFVLLTGEKTKGHILLSCLVSGTF